LPTGYQEVPQHRLAQIGDPQITLRHPSTQMRHQLQLAGCGVRPIPQPRQLRTETIGEHRQRPGHPNPFWISHNASFSKPIEESVSPRAPDYADFASPSTPAASTYPHQIGITPTSA
jgi:hypothetical protein